MKNLKKSFVIFFFVVLALAGVNIYQNNKIENYMELAQSYGAYAGSYQGINDYGSMNQNVYTPKENSASGKTDYRDAWHYWY